MRENFLNFSGRPGNKWESEPLFFKRNYLVIFKDDSDIRIDTEDVQFWKFRHRVLEELVVWASLFVAKATSITFLTSLCLSLSMSLTVLWILFTLKSNVEKVYSNKHTYQSTLQSPWKDVHKVFQWKTRHLYKFFSHTIFTTEIVGKNNKNVW